MQYPWALLLLVPALVAWWHIGGRGAGRWWRLLVLVALVVAAAGPRTRGATGTDVILVLDRSESLGARRDEQAEWVRMAAAQRRAGDRLGVVAVGAGAQVLAPPQDDVLPDMARITVDPTASELAAGVRLARSLVGRGRAGRVVVISDGEDTGTALATEAAAAAADGIVVDALEQAGPGTSDAAIVSVELPGTLRSGESFIGAVRVTSDRAGVRPWRVERGRVLVAEGSADVRPGAPTTITFADRPPGPGLVTYRVVLDATDDRQPLNNEAQACLRVEGGEHVLVMSGHGAEGNLAASLAAAGLPVVTCPEGPVGLRDLMCCAAVVLEQVPADRLGRAGQEALATWVRHAGGGLVMTGGRRGFGGGGWRKSPVEDVLPVSCEVRDEQRKLAVAMAIVLDRSGSMAAPVAGGRTKMDLADEGACAALELLGPRDRVAVLAVDTQVHDIVPLTPVTGRGSLVAATRGIVSAGGGIYVRTAVAAAGAQVLRADTGTRHVVLFADASDAEEQAGSLAVVDDLARAGVTLSVVAMGTPADPDAAFLQQLAEHGHGRCQFAAEPEDLPRLFAQETLLVARSTWIDQAVQPTAGPAMAVALPGLPALPTLPGYNLTYLREGAQSWAWCAGDPAAPGVAAWRCGAGRSVTLGFDHEALGTWPGRAALLAGCVRWAAGGGRPAASLTVQRHGRLVDLHVLAPLASVVAPTAHLLGDDGREAGVVELQREGPGRWHGVAALPGTTPVLPVALVDDLAVSAAPVVVPYGPEAEPRGDRPSGAATLAALARAGGGQVRADLHGLWADLPPATESYRDLAPLAVAVALAALLAEIAVRRLSLSVSLAVVRSCARALAWRIMPRRGLSRQPASPTQADPPAPPASAPSAFAHLRDRRAQSKR